MESRLGVPAAVCAVIGLAGCGGSDLTEPATVLVDKSLVRLAGLVRDTSGVPVQGAEVSYQFSDRIYSTLTSGTGEYALNMRASDVAGIVYPAVTVSKQGLVPQAVVFPSFSGGSTYNASPSMPALPANMSIPEGGHYVWHVGDDSYGGAINSQLQKASDGVSRTFPISDWGERVRAGGKAATVTMLARGYQSSRCASAVALSGDVGTVSQRGPDSPTDGSWGLMRFTFQVAQVGRQIAAVRVFSGKCDVGDQDDFEFTRLTVEFS